MTPKPDGMETRRNGGAVSDRGGPPSRQRREDGGATGFIGATPDRMGQPPGIKPLTFSDLTSEKV
jgi:hypothetical protein